MSKGRKERGLLACRAVVGGIECLQRVSGRFTAHKLTPVHNIL